MKLSKIIIVCMLLTTIGVKAEDKIDYSWAEINFDYVDTDAFGSVRSTTFAGSYAINDSFYVTGDFSQMHLGSTSLHENSYEFSLGFHKSLTEKTDFYAELGYRQYDVWNTGGIVSTVGTRTLLSDKFELITAIGYKDYNVQDERQTIDRFNADDEGFNVAVTALYKFNENSFLHFGAKQKASEIAPMIGYRYSW